MKFFISGGDVDVKLILTAQGGDPDLYVSTTLAKPNRTHFDYSSSDGDGDIVVIRHDDQKLVECQSAAGCQVKKNMFSVSS